MLIAIQYSYVSSTVMLFKHDVIICNPCAIKTGCKWVNQETVSPVVSLTNKGSQALQNTQEKTFRSKASPQLCYYYSSN